MASLASPLRGYRQDPRTGRPRPDTEVVYGRRASDRSGARPQHALRGGEVALSQAANAVESRAARYRRSLAIADLLSAALALTLSVQVLGDDQLRLTTFIALPLVVALSKVMGLYDRDEIVLNKKTVDEAPAIFQQATLYTLIFWILENQFIVGHLGKDQVVGIWGSFFLVALATRSAARSFAQRTTPPERVAVVGEPVECAHVRAKLNGNRHVAADVVAELPHRPRRKGETYWTADMIADVVAYHSIDRMIIAPWTTGNDEVVDLVRIAKGIGLNVSVLPGVFEAVGSHVAFDELDGMTVLSIPRFELSRSSRAVKRALDIGGAAFGLLVASPILALLALAVRLDSRGPVFFRQTRVGRDGRRFQITKFRTMVSDAEERKAELLHLNEQDGLFKIADDPRVTRLGRFLRKTSLDELPQLINVFKGEMSLVGPRPLVVDEDDLVRGWSRRRLHLTPGMTGPWQILGGGRVPLQEMVKIDYLYVTGWSLWTDVKLLLRTAGYVFARASV